MARTKAIRPIWYTNANVIPLAPSPGPIWEFIRHIFQINDFKDLDDPMVLGRHSVFADWLFSEPREWPPPEVSPRIIILNQ